MKINLSSQEVPPLNPTERVKVFALPAGFS